MNIHPLPRHSSEFRFSIRCNSDVLTKSVTENRRMFILGLGFVAQSFASNLKNKGWVVSGTCTSVSKQKKLEESGFNAFVFDANDPQWDILDAIYDHTHLIISIPTLISIGDPVLQHREILKSRLKGGNLQWMSYLSSTSVYGDCKGAWVDEDYPARPMSDSGKARLAAELAWLKLGRELSISAQVFRLGGIYGPGRSAIDTIIKRGSLSKTQKIRSSRQYTSRIHVSDICQTLNASIQKPSNGNIYNVVDDEPAPREEVFKYARSLIEKKWAGYIEEEEVADVAELGGYIGEKRVKNVRIKKELGVRLLHSSYRSGLQSIIEHMDNPFMQNSSKAIDTIG